MVKQNSPIFSRVEKN